LSEKINEKKKTQLNAGRVVRTNRKGTATGDIALKLERNICKRFPDPSR